MTKTVFLPLLSRDAVYSYIMGVIWNQCKIWASDLMGAKLSNPPHYVRLTMYRYNSATTFGILFEMNITVIS